MARSTGSCPRLTRVQVSRDATEPSYPIGISRRLSTWAAGCERLEKPGEGERVIRNDGVGHRPRRLRVDPRVAVVGLGYWGPNLVRVLIERTDVEVGWICDTDLSRLERFGRRYPSVQLTQDLDEVLEDPCIDGVLLATT